MHDFPNTLAVGDSQPALENPYLDAMTADAEAVDQTELTDRYAWAVPNAAAIGTIAREGPVLEVGAGSGYWAMLLEQAGADVVATDPSAPFDPEWTEVEPLTAQEAIAEYPGRTLLIVWPSDGASWPADALEAYDGDTVIYVGEGPGGCTADGRFHRVLRRDWHCEGSVPIPQHPHAHDALEVWRADRSLLERLLLPGARALGLTDGR